MYFLMDKIKTWFNSNKQRNICIIIIIILLLLMYGSLNIINGLKTDIAFSQQNITALTDTIRVSKNKAGEASFSKSVLVVNNAKDLAKLNKDLADELKKTKGKVYELNRIVVGFKNNPNDTIKIQNTLVVYPKGKYGLAWKYDTVFSPDNSRLLSGLTMFKLDSNNSITPLETILSKDELNFKLKVGLREINKKIEIFAESDYPGFSVIKLDGAQINPENNPVLKKLTSPKKFNIGPTIGYGVQFSNGSVTYGPQIGVSFMYSLISF